MLITSDHVRAIEEARSLIDLYGFGYVDIVVRASKASPEVARWALFELCTPNEGETDTVATYEYVRDLRTGEEREVWWGTYTRLARTVPMRMLRYADPVAAQERYEKQRTLRKRRRPRRRPRTR